MRLPTVHLNGTHPDNLRRSNRAAAAAVREALARLAEAAPHGRDYYPQGDGAFAEAQAEHQARVAVLTAVYDDLMKITQRCALQQRTRYRRQLDEQRELDAQDDAERDEMDACSRMQDEQEAAQAASEEGA